MAFAEQLSLADRVWIGIYANVATLDVLLAVRSIETLGKKRKSNILSLSFLEVPFHLAPYRKTCWKKPSCQGDSRDQ